VRFTRSTYPDYPGISGSPCWQVKGRWLYFDADWNTRFPFGTSVAVHVGPQPDRTDQPNLTPGFLLDLNAPLGEPNRLYLWLGRWHVILGLPSVRSTRETGRTGTFRGQEIPVIENFSNWLHPHIDGCDRYRYHQDDTGRWIRNDKPEPLHWGWLTMTRAIPG